MNKQSEQPWKLSYPPGLEWEMQALDQPAHSIFENSARQFPERPCLDFLGAKYTYADIVNLIDRFARGLQDIGIKKGERIGLCLPNSPYYVVAYFAVLKIGASVVNFNILYTAREVSQQIDDSEIKLMVTLDLKFIFNKVKPALDDKSIEAIIYCPLAEALPPVKKYLLKYFRFFQFIRPARAENLYSYAQVIASDKALDAVAINPAEDIALFQYTGGTTGKPKAAMLTHSNIVSNTEQVTLWLQQGDKLIGQKKGQEKFLAVLPFFHVFSMTVAMNLALRFGAEIYLLPRFEIKQCLQTLSAKGITILPAVPAIFNAINRYPKRKRYDLGSLRYGISGGASLPKEVKQEFEANSQCLIVEGYGLSEASPVITCNPAHSEGKTGSIGLPLPGTRVEFRAIDDINEKETPGEIGQLLAKGPQVMQGYWNRAEDNAKTLLENKWLCTGDVGYMDTEGYVFLTDRLKDIIITNGYNVYPRHIEEAFYQHADVDEVIAVGVPDVDKGEVPMVFVKLKSGRNIDGKELLEFVEDKLNPIEMPDSIEIRDELPKTLIGKPSKKALLEEVAKKQDAAKQEEKS